MTENNENLDVIQNEEVQNDFAQNTGAEFATQQVGADELDFSLFTGGDAGYQVLSNEKLQSLSKKLPSWSLEPPAKYIK